MPGKSAFGLSSSLGALKSIADVLREVDVRPIREAAERPFLISFISRDALLARHIASLLYCGPRAHDTPPGRTIEAVALEEALCRPAFGQLAVIVTREDRDNTAETQLIRRLQRANIPALVCFVDAPGTPPLLRQQWLPAAMVSLHTIGDAGHTLDDKQAIRQLTAAIRAAKVVDSLALARHLPAFREQIARSLIEETAVANAAYSASTGIAEIVPIVTLPLNMADLVVLTKNQALMAYKIALAMGRTPDFRHIMPQIATVVGGGFVFRQIARTLVGLVPGWGILPKTAIAFAGTFAMGEAIYRWCATGEQLTEDALRQVYYSALARGRGMAQALLKSQRQRKRRPGQHGSTVEQAG